MLDELDELDELAAPVDEFDTVDVLIVTDELVAPLPPEPLDVELTPVVAPLVDAPRELELVVPVPALPPRLEVVLGPEVPLVPPVPLKSPSPRMLVHALPAAAPAHRTNAVIDLRCIRISR